MRPRRLAADVLLAAVALTSSLAASPSGADGDPAPTYQRERAVQRFKDCHWTDEMGKYVYQCIKKNDGMNAHWCYDEALETLCPAQLETAKKPAVQTEPASRPQNN